MEPSTGKAPSAKQAALSETQSNAPNVMTRPEATRSPDVVGRDHVRKETPVVALCPTVGANCRVLLHDSAIGDGIEEWGHRTRTSESVGGIEHERGDTAMYPGSGPSMR